MSPPTPVSETPWTDYATKRPEVAGIYEWRLPSATLPGCHVTFLGHMRERGAGYESVLSPAFDHWNGYSVSVHPATQWRPAPEKAKCERHEYTSMAIEGLGFSACPYCDKTPVLQGFQRAGYGGLVVCADPNHLNSWSLKCCAWGSTPSMPDPREIERIRQAAFERIRTTAA